MDIQYLRVYLGDRVILRRIKFVVVYSITISLILVNFEKKFARFPLCRLQKNML